MCRIHTKASSSRVRWAGTIVVTSAIGEGRSECCLLNRANRSREGEGVEKVQITHYNPSVRVLSSQLEEGTPKKNFNGESLPGSDDK